MRYSCFPNKPALCSVCRRQGPSLVADDHLPLRPWHDDVPVRPGERGHQLHVEVPQQMAPYQLKLHVRERLADADVPSGAERQVRQRAAGLVLRSPGREPIRVVLVRFVVDVRQPVVEHQRAGDRVALGHLVLAAVPGPHGEAPPRVAEQHQRGRVQAQGFLDAAVQGVHLLQHVVVDAVTVPRHDTPLLLDGGAQVLGVGEEARPGPGARAGAVVLPREERGDEHPDDLRLRRPAAVLVPGVEQALQHVVVVVVVGAALAGPDDLGEYLA